MKQVLSFRFDFVAIVSTHLLKLFFSFITIPYNKKGLSSFRDIGSRIRDVKYKSNLGFMTCSTIDEIQDRSYMSVISFTGMRNKDLHGIKSRNIIFERCVDGV